MAVSIYTPDFTVEEAVSRGHDVFDVTLTNWARTTGDFYVLPNVVALGQPIPLLSFPFSPAAVMIGPRSTVDRCWVSWNAAIAYRNSPPAFDPEHMTREMSVDSPLFFSQPAGKGSLDPTPFASIITEAQNRNFLAFFPIAPFSQSPVNDPLGCRSTVIVGGQGFRRFDGTTGVFPGLPLPGQIPNAAPNVLQLRFILKPGVQIASNKRFPYVTTSGDKFLGTLPSGITTRIGVVPTYGRKNLVIDMFCSEVGAIAQIGAIRNVNPQVSIYETLEAQKVFTVANAPLRFQLCDPAADWLLFYLTTPGGAGGKDGAFTLLAYD